MKIAIVGSRGYSDLSRVREYVKALPWGSVVVSGGARGVDSAAEQAAKEAGLEVLIFLPDWNKHGKKAGFLRNIDIVNAADKVVAFWDKVSRGTKHSMDLATKAGKTLEVF